MRVSRLGLLDGLATAGAAVTFTALSSPWWYEVNDGYFSAWRFHTWLDLAVTAFVVATVLVVPARLLHRPTRATTRLGVVASALGALAVAMLLVRGVLGEPRLYNPSGDELDIAGTSGGVWICLFFAVLTWAVTGAAAWSRLRAGKHPVQPFELRRVRGGDWLAAGASLVLLGALPADWYGREPFSPFTAFDVFRVTDLLLLVVAAPALLLPFLAAARASPPWALRAVALVVGAVGVLAIVVHAVSPPAEVTEHGIEGDSLIKTTENGLWVGLVATVGVCAGAGWALRRQRAGE